MTDDVPRAPAEPPDVADLQRRLTEAEATIAALLKGQIDAVLDVDSRTPLLLAKAQTALRESEARYRQIVETANEGIVTVDRLSMVTFVNRRLTEILGYSAADMLGKSLFRFVSEAAAVLAAMRVERSHQGTSEELEVSFRRKDGTELVALMNTSPIKDVNDRYLGTLAMITDRTRTRRSPSLSGA